MDDLTVFRLGSEHFLIVSGLRNRLKIRDWAMQHAMGRRAYASITEDGCQLVPLGCARVSPPGDCR